MILPWWHITILGLWVLWIAQAVLCALQARKFSRHLRCGDRPGFEAFRPPAVVFVPFKGLDTDAVANLHGLLKQDYPDFRCVLIVESRYDPAFAFLTEETPKYPDVQTDIIIAGPADQRTGQKVHNLLAGLRFLESQPPEQTADPDQAWVFADSDAVPNPQWLGNLVGPLVQRDLTAVSTGYRWMVPARGPRGRFKLGGQIASVINAGIATFAANEHFRFAWGGSMAMLAQTAQEGNLKQLWDGALSDDYQVTRMTRQLGKRIYFLPECIVESPVDMTLGNLAEFARRQYLITRIHEPAFFAQGFAVVALYLAALVTTWATLIFALLHQQWGLALQAAAVLLAVAAGNQLRAMFRRRSVHELFGTGTYERLAPAFRLDQWATSAIMALNFALLGSALFGRSIAWRHKRYTLYGPQHIDQHI